MTAVPARVAGIRRIAVATPRPSPAMLATARELGVDEVWSMGGAQAIAALAYGTETIPAVAKIVGPGNRWVTEAKLLVSGHVAIDLPAGPSEVLVIADDTADPDECAADLLAQAEHGPDGEAILVTTSSRVADEVRARTNGRARVELVACLADAVTRANELAPEHLELLVADPDALVARRAQCGRRLPGHDGGARRLRGRLEPRPPDGRPGPRHGRPGPGGVPQAGAVRPRDAGGSRRSFARRSKPWRRARGASRSMPRQWR